MSYKSIRLSIVIATKDRYETLYDCIDSLLLNYDCEDVEIVVRDNSAWPQTENFIARFGEQRNVYYTYDKVPVSQSENYELGVANARGEYVTMIGDDDGICGGLLELIKWMEQSDLDAFFPGFAVYLWPGAHGRFRTSNPDGYLVTPEWSGPRLIDPVAQRETVLARGSTSMEELPRMYYGLVRRRCLERLRQDANACFPGPSPDMANAFALSYVVKRMAVAQLPIFIAGNSSRSNAGLGLRGRHVGEIADMPFLPRDCAENWNSSIPFFWSGQTIWCQSAYSAAVALGKEKEFEAHNNYRALYARVLVFQPRYFWRLLSAVRARHKSGTLLALSADFWAITTVSAQLLTERVLGFARRLTGVGKISMSQQVTNLPSIIDATIQAGSAISARDIYDWLDQGLE